MLRDILLLMLAVMLNVSEPAILWAGGEDALDPETPASVSEGNTVARAAVSHTAEASADDGYLIGPGDVLDISVWKDEALTRSCTVRPDGVISFPLIGDVRVAGRTSSQIKAEMEKRLEKYVPDAVLSLDIKQVNSLIIYVIGRVNVPGRFVMNANVDVLQALAVAGGLNVYAKRNRIKIFRQVKNKTAIFPFEYDEVVDGKHLEQNIMLKRGDVVVIP